eukprot:c22710_g1_i2 orf=314-1267(+)
MGFSSDDAPKGDAVSKEFLQPKRVNNRWKKGKRKNGSIRVRNGNKRRQQQQQQQQLQQQQLLQQQHLPFFSLPLQVVTLPQTISAIPKSQAQVWKSRFKKRRMLPRSSLSTFKTPHAPRNTTSFIIRAKKLGGIAPLVTPSPATPAVFPTPCLSPGFRYKSCPEAMNKELGVDGYGSMNGLIRLRAYGEKARCNASEGESEGERVDQGVEDQSVQSVERLEQRIDQDLSRFEIIYPSDSSRSNATRDLENCLDDQEGLIARLEEENLTLKERLFLVRQEVNELRQRVRRFEEKDHAGKQVTEHLEESCGDVSCPPCT